MKKIFKNNASITFDCLKAIIAGMSAFLLLFLLTGCANWEVVDCDHHHCDHHHHFDHHVDHHHYHHYTPRQIHYHEHVTKSKPLLDRPQRPVNAPSRPISKGVPPKRTPTRKDD